jgi:4-hydroxy-tetrahydrodipicolinate synthase
MAPLPTMTTRHPSSTRVGAGLRGTWYILPTPFDGDGALDVRSLARLTEAAIDWGVDGLTAMGVMAEPGSLSADERELALRTIFAAATGRVPIAVGCSGPTVGSVATLAGQARRLGAVALMVAPPTLLRNVDLLPDFYRAVAAEAGLPLIVQDEPAATGVTVPVSILLDSLAASGARTVKLEDPPTAPKIGRLLAADPGLAVFGGLGGAAALWELQRGACGTMTGFAFPEVLKAIRLAHEAGDDNDAGRLFDRYLPLLAYEAQPGVGLAIRKEVLRRRGALDHAGTRGPGGPLDEPTLAGLDAILGRLRIVPSIAPYLPAA